LVKELTAEEVSNLWNSYLTNTMAAHFGRYLLKTCEDKDVYNILKQAEKIAVIEAEKSKHFLEEANYPIPNGFDEQDADINAPRLYSDNSILLIKYMLSQDANTAYSLFLSTSTRSDIREFFESCLISSVKFHSQCAGIIVKKGLHNPELHIPKPEKIDKVDKQSFLAGWLTDKRPLTVQEINSLTYNFKGRDMHNELLRSFAQITSSKELIAHFQRGSDLCLKHMDIIQSILTKNDLPKLPTWESEITDVTTPIFSDRLMLFKISAITAAGASRYGAAVSTSMRRDIGVQFMSLMGELLKYGEDSMNLMIKYGYLDQLPMAKHK
jgi:hypothetical protein